MRAQSLCFCAGEAVEIKAQSRDFQTFRLFFVSLLIQFHAIILHSLAWHTHSLEVDADADADAAVACGASDAADGPASEPPN